MAKFRVLPRIAIAAFVALVLAAVATIAQEEASSGARMVDSADQFLESLSPDLRKKATFEFDDPHRTAWFFTPQQDKDRNFTRKGVRLEELNDDRKRKRWPSSRPERVQVAMNKPRPL